MSRLTTKRGGGGRRIFWDNKPVGEAFKFTHGRGYGLRLDGVYWRRGAISLRGGGSTIALPLMRDAIAKAEQALNQLDKLRIEP